MQGIRHQYSQCSGNRRDFANSQNHRYKTRLLQAFLFLLPLLDKVRRLDFNCSYVFRIYLQETTLPQSHSFHCFPNEYSSLLYFLVCASVSLMLLPDTQNWRPSYAFQTWHWLNRQLYCPPLSICLETWQAKLGRTTHPKLPALWAQAAFFASFVMRTKNPIHSEDWPVARATWKTKLTYLTSS